MIPTAHQPIWHDVVEITAVVKGNAILTGNLTFTFVNALLMGGFIYLLTPISQEVYKVGAGEYSQLFAFVGVGAFIGGLTLGLSGGFRRTGYALLGTNFLTAGVAIVFALVASLYVGFGFALLFGLINAIHISLGNMALQMAITDNVRGRLAGIYEVAWAGFPAGGFVFGAMADALGSSSVTDHRLQFRHYCDDRDRRIKPAAAAVADARLRRGRDYLRVGLRVEIIRLIRRGIELAVDFHLFLLGQILRGAADGQQFGL